MKTELQNSTYVFIILKIKLADITSYNLRHKLNCRGGQVRLQPQPARTKLDLIQKTKSDKCTRNISTKCIRNQTRSQVAILISAVLIPPSQVAVLNQKLFLVITGRNYFSIYLFVLRCTTINISVLVAIYSTVIKRPSSLTSEQKMILIIHLNDKNHSRIRENMNWK